MTAVHRFNSLPWVRILLTPEAVAPRWALLACTAAMLTVFALDVLTPPDIRLHVLYIFPLAWIALHSDRVRSVICGLALSITLQLTTFFYHGISRGPLITDMLVALGASVLTMVLAAGVRENHLVIKELATHDSLTGLHNRRSFESILTNEMGRLERYGGAFSLVMLDLDEFKQLNDTRGHGVGDKALQLLATILQEHSRQTDSLARLGGDEFAILMPNTGEIDSGLRCNHLTAMIAERMANSGFGLTASLGCMTFVQTPESTADALHRVDTAMYAAKASRKNFQPKRHQLQGR